MTKATNTSSAYIYMSRKHSPQYAYKTTTATTTITTATTTTTNKQCTHNCAVRGERKRKEKEKKRKKEEENTFVSLRYAIQKCIYLTEPNQTKHSAFSSLTSLRKV